jgi:hypothetical protein
MIEDGGSRKKKNEGKNDWRKENGGRGSDKEKMN